MPFPSNAEILSTFDHHTPTPEQVDRITLIRASFKQTASDVLAICPPGADRTAALRQLHEAMMTANKSIACEPGQASHPEFPDAKPIYSLDAMHETVKRIEGTLTGAGVTG